MGCLRGRLGTQVCRPGSVLPAPLPRSPAPRPLLPPQTGRHPAPVLWPRGHAGRRHPLAGMRAGQGSFRQPSSCQPSCGARRWLSLSPMPGCDSHPGPATRLALQHTAAARDGCSSPACQRANEHPGWQAGGGLLGETPAWTPVCSWPRSGRVLGDAGTAGETPCHGCALGHRHQHRSLLTPCRAVLGPGTTWPCSHHGCAHTVAVLTPWLCSHRGRAHTMAVLTPWPCSRHGRAHTLAMLTPWPCSHLGHAHTVAVLTPWPCSHLGHAHTMAVLTPCPCSHQVHAFTMPMFTLWPCAHCGVYSHIMSLLTVSSCSHHIPAHTISLLTPCPCLHRVPARTVSLLTPYPCSHHIPAHTISLLTPCPCSHHIPAHTVSLFTPYPCSHRVPAHAEPVLTPRQTVPPAPHTEPTAFPTQFLAPQQGQEEGPPPWAANVAGVDVLHSSPPAHPTSPHAPVSTCGTTPAVRALSVPRDGPARRGRGGHLVLQEPGKNEPGIKLAGAFIAGILFLNAMENTSPEGKSQRSGPACGTTAYVCPRVNVPLGPGRDAGREPAGAGLQGAVRGCSCSPGPGVGGTRGGRAGSCTWGGTTPGTSTGWG